MNATDLRHFIGDMTEDPPIVVTFGVTEHRIVDAVVRDGKLVLVAEAK